MDSLDATGVFQTIMNFIRTSKNPALFAGAGVGAYAGLPAWSQLMEHLAKVAEQYQEIETAQVIRKRYMSGHYLNAATVFKTCPTIPRGEIFNQIAANFSNVPEYKKLNALVSLPFCAIFTTNYDRSLHDAYSDIARRSPKTVELNDTTMRIAPFNKDFYIARLHGRAEVPDTIILDESDYKQLLANRDYLDLLSHAFSNYEFLFIGFSFLDPAIAFVLDIVEQRVSPNFPKMHIALLPMDANKELITRLAQKNIKTLYYDPSYNYFALWEGIKLASREIPNETKRNKPVAEFPLKPIQRFLATSYARLKISKTIQPLREVVIDGMLITMLRETDSKTVLMKDILSSVQDFLNIPIHDCETLLAERINYLTIEGTIQQDNDLISLVSQNFHDLTDDLKILIQGIENRILVRHGGKDIYPELIDAAKNSIERILLARGWDLGANYVGAIEENQLDITSTIRSIIDKFSAKLPEADKERLFFSCVDLFQNPDTTESQILASLGRVSFALQIIMNKPSEVVTHKALLPELIYLDSNVLMPAIVVGHPFQQVYSDALKRLVDACKNAGVSLNIAIAEPFLEEILHHKEIAISEVEEMELDNPDRLYEHIQLHSSGVNVYVIAFSSIKKMDPQISFQAFLKKYAPYNDIGSLKEFIKTWNVNFLSLNFDRNEMPDYIRYFNELKGQFNTAPEYQRKKDILIEHEARQLLRVKLDLDKNFRVLFVTMDNKLRKFSRGPILGYPGSALITHTGLVQLIDMLIGFETDAGSMARLLWGSYISDEKLVIINYFTNLALRDYDAAMAMSLPEVLDVIVPMVSQAARKEGISLAPGANTNHKIEITKFMDRFEDRFYENMAEAIRKREKDVEE